jgi:uncharacterized protein YfaP (DUF2135 family)
VALLWSAPVDLDLYVTDPVAETVYFGNTPSGSGGRLERDRRCGDLGREPPVETVVWDAPRPGRYRVGVDFGDTCGRGHRTVPFRVVADAGSRRIEEIGSVEPAEFRYVVFEFDVEEGAR